jgi:hypothetical protein
MLKFSPLSSIPELLQGRFANRPYFGYMINGSSY